MKSYVCKRCKNSFVSDHFTALCPECRIGHCIVCGKEFRRDYIEKETCSRQCAAAWKKKNGIYKQIAAKSKQTCLERYGVENPFQSEEIKDKIKQTNIEKYGVENPAQNESIQARIQQTNLERYGVANVAQNSEIRQKMKSTNLERYGVEYAAQNMEIQEKTKQTNLERYGVENPLQNERIRDKVKQTNLEKYGVKNVFQDEQVKEKIKQTMLARYGAEYTLQSAELKEKVERTNVDRYGVENVFQHGAVRDKIKQDNTEKYGFAYPMQNVDVQEKKNQTNLERYGHINPLQNDEIKEKAKQTNLERYGVECPFQNADVKAKVRETMLSRYGVEHAQQNDDIKQKTKQTNLKQYGTENVFQNKEVQAKFKQTNLERYGVEHPLQTAEIAKRQSRTQVEHFLSTIEDPTVRENYRLFHEDPKAFVLKNFDSKPTISEVADATGVDYCTVDYQLLGAGCQDLVKRQVSSLEDEVVDFLRSVDSDLNIVRNTRKIISPMEIDIYLPDYKIGIECNPTYTHNSTLPSFSCDYPISKGYHQKKSSLCQDSGVFLFHIFGWEWKSKQTVIKSMLRNLLGACENRYYARNLNVVELNQSECAEFLNQNHRQGSLKSLLRLGLVDSSHQLVSVMTFNRMRSGIGRTLQDTENTWELSRFCSLLDTSVVGGASKLFKYFIDHQHPDKVVSFSDVAHTKGILYQKLGFRKVSVSTPGYVWVNHKTDFVLSREKCQKKNLKKLFDDNTIDTDHMTEAEIMAAHGFVQIFDSGVVRWEWSKI